MVRSSANVALGKCTILTFVGKTVGNSCPWTNGLRQDTAITAAHTSRISWRIRILRTSTTNENYFTFTGLFLGSAKGLRRLHHRCVPSRRRHHIPGRPNQRPVVNPQSLIAPRDIHQSRRHHCQRTPHHALETNAP